MPIHADLKGSREDSPVLLSMWLCDSPRPWWLRHCRALEHFRATSVQTSSDNQALRRSCSERADAIAIHSHFAGPLTADSNGITMERTMENRMRYLYGPHFAVVRNGSTQYPRMDLGQAGWQEVELISLQVTWLKQSTELSSELQESQRSVVPLGARLNARLRAVCGEERRRHSGSRDHFEVILTPASESALRLWQLRWIIYKPHWKVDGNKAVALQFTCLKRSWQASHLLPTHEKLCIRSGETLRLQGPPRALGSDGMVHTGVTTFVQDHAEIDLSDAELQRVHGRAPRPALCKYFSADAPTLSREIQTCLTDAIFGPGYGGYPGSQVHRLHPQALLLPHGAFCNSGYVAAHGFRLLEGMELSLAIIIGNNHCSWNRLALCDQDWATPFGLVLADQVALKRMQEMCPSYEVKRLVHAAEHSIENQLPFLQHLHPKCQILPIGVGAVDLEDARQIASNVAKLVIDSGPGTLLLGTTDFSHEGPSYGGPALPMAEITELTRQKDRALLQAVRDMDAEKLLEMAADKAQRCSMCGAGAAAVLLLACRALQLRCRQLRYLVNTEVTPCDSTTGFAAFAFERVP
eukprot:s777_g54.t2